MKIRTALAAASAAALLSGCMTMTPASYMVTPAIKQDLAKYQGAKVDVVQVTGPADFNAMCRAAGDIKIENGLSVPQFVQKAFNDEFKYAGIGGDGGMHLTGRLTHAEFSSSASLVNGWWLLALDLRSSNGKSLAVESRYDFESGFSAITACSNTSMALAQATQKLIRATIEDPRFTSLVR